VHAARATVNASRKRMAVSSFGLIQETTGCSPGEVAQYLRVTEVDMKATRRTSTAIQIQANATENAAWRTADWGILLVAALAAWTCLGGPILFFAVGLTILGAVNSLGAWYRMRRYLFEKYRAKPSTHIV
jgi:hypothetical protein